MKKTYTICETLVVSKTVEIEVEDEIFEEDIEDLVRDAAYEQCIIPNGWSMDDCLDVQIWEEK